jgi:hypothetical protein
MSETERPGDDPLAPDAGLGEPGAADDDREAEGSAELDAESKRHTDFQQERERVRLVLEDRWRCRVFTETEGMFDWYFIRNDTVAGIASYTQHRESGNVLIRARRWHHLRMWSTALRVPHFWVVDFLSQGIRYKMWPPMTGERFELLAKDDTVWVSIPQNTFDILKEA